MDKNIENLEELRKDFIKRFSRQNLEKMTVDEYSLNKQDNALSKESFCYWVETKLRGLGSIKGATADKFGTYFGETKSDPTYKRRWTGWTNESFETIRAALIELYDAGEREDINTIKKSKISPMFKGKILSLYFPHRYLNIFAKEHLYHFLNKLSIPHSANDDPVDLREKLIAYKNANPRYSRLSAIEFGHELYAKYGRPDKGEEQNEPAEELYEHSQKKEINRSFKNVPKYSDTPEDVPEQISTSYGQVYKIDPAKSRRAIVDADFTCEADKNHESFTRKNGKERYTEAHHFIPRSYQKNYLNSLDVTANIVSLCSNCHNCLHYGSADERNQILEKLYKDRKKRLEYAGLKITLNELRNLY